MQFDYLIKKIKNAEVSTDPFDHIYIEDFFSDPHFQDITQSTEINLEPAANDDALFERLFEAGYKIIDFPGCVIDRDQYVKWHRQRAIDRTTNSACEGYGMTLRLTAPKTPIIAQLHDFLVGDAFQNALAEKFEIASEAVFADSGIQKYLDGYEISPHPDIRKKALTYMVNVNPHAGSDTLEHHTHYLRFREAYRYVQAFWEGNADQDRCWVPWDWCDTVKTQTKNNSIVIFSPGNNTMHGVKANYDHLAGQRTQLYGNLWYRETKVAGAPSWEDLSFSQRQPTTEPGKLNVWAERLRKYQRRLSPSSRRDRNVIEDRLKSSGS